MSNDNLSPGWTLIATYYTPEEVAERTGLKPDELRDGMNRGALRMRRWPMTLWIPHDHTDFMRAYRRPRLPFGWRVYLGYAEDGIDRFNAWEVGPTWFYPFWWLWRWRWMPVALLVRLGLFKLEEGGYYRDARPVDWPGRESTP